MTLIKFKNEGKEKMPYFSEFFNDMYDNMLTSDLRRISMPAVNIEESDDQFRLELAVPGLRKEDFKISVEKDVLTVSAERQSEKDEKKKRYTRREFNYVSFSRNFTLPEVVDAGKIIANYDHGVMEVVLPKKAEARPTPAREIKIA